MMTPCTPNRKYSLSRLRSRASSWHRVSRKSILLNQQKLVRSLNWVRKFNRNLDLICLFSRELWGFGTDSSPMKFNTQKKCLVMWNKWSCRKLEQYWSYYIPSWSRGTATHPSLCSPCAFTSVTTLSTWSTQDYSVRATTSGRFNSSFDWTRWIKCLGASRTQPLTKNLSQSGSAMRICRRVIFTSTALTSLSTMAMSMWATVAD